MFVCIIILELVNFAFFTFLIYPAKDFIMLLNYLGKLTVIITLKIVPAHSVYLAFFLLKLWFYLSWTLLFY